MVTWPGLTPPSARELAQYIGVAEKAIVRWWPKLRERGLVRRKPAKRPQPYIVPTRAAVALLREIAHEETRSAQKERDDEAVKRNLLWRQEYESDVLPPLDGGDARADLIARFGYSPVDAWSHLRPKKPHGGGGWRDKAEAGVDYD